MTILVPWLTCGGAAAVGGVLIYWAINSQS